MIPYDKTITVNDLITSYKKGIYRVVNIERRFYTEEDAKHFDFLEQKYGRRPCVGDEQNPLIYSRRLLDSNFKKRAGEDSCDASFCAKLDSSTLKKVERLLSNDPSIEENSIKKINRIEKLHISIDNTQEAIIELAKCELAKARPCISMEVLLPRICPQLFTDIEVANGFVNAGKQFACKLNEEYVLDIIYDEVEGKKTEFVRGEIRCLT